MDAVAADSLEADVIYACGPTPMLRAIKQYAQENKNRVLHFDGRKNGLRSWRLSGMCLSVEGSGSPQPCTQQTCLQRRTGIFGNGGGTVMDMRVKIAGVEWNNPVTVASGTFGSGEEYSEFVDLNRLGAVTTKGVANVPWPGNPTPRVAEIHSGMMNAIGLQNPGIDVFCERDIPFLRQYDTKIIVNVCGRSTEDYCEVVERLANEDVDMLEINISCPNVKEGGIAFGQNPKAAEEITRAVKKYAKQPVIMKLSPNVTSISEMAKAVEAGGADAISLINTLTGMKIDINRKTFALANKTGGVSGPAIASDRGPHGI